MNISRRSVFLEWQCIVDVFVVAIQYKACSRTAATISRCQAPRQIAMFQWYPRRQTGCGLQAAYDVICEATKTFISSNRHRINPTLKYIWQDKKLYKGSQISESKHGMNGHGSYWQGILYIMRMPCRVYPVLFLRIWAFRLNAQSDAVGSAIIIWQDYQFDSLLCVDKTSCYPTYPRMALLIWSGTITAGINVPDASYTHQWQHMIMI